MDGRDRRCGRIQNIITPTQRKRGRMAPDVCPSGGLILCAACPIRSSLKFTFYAFLFSSEMKERPQATEATRLSRMTTSRPTGMSASRPSMRWSFGKNCSAVSTRTVSRSHRRSSRSALVYLVLDALRKFARWRLQNVSKCTAEVVTSLSAYLSQAYKRYHSSLVNRGMDHVTGAAPLIENSCYKCRGVWVPTLAKLRMIECEKSGDLPVEQTAARKGLSALSFSALMGWKRLVCPASRAVVEREREIRPKSKRKLIFELDGRCPESHLEQQRTCSAAVGNGMSSSLE